MKKIFKLKLFRFIFYRPFFNKDEGMKNYVLRWPFIKIKKLLLPKNDLEENN